MFVPLWLIFLGSGLAMAVITVVWGIRSGQFEDQERARYLPLQGLSRAELSRASGPRRPAVYLGVWTMLLTGVAALAGALALVIRHHYF